MENGFFLITGTSRGIGEALAKKLLDMGNTVLGISRSQSNKLKSIKYHHLLFDLLDLSRVNQIMDKAGDIVSNRSFDMVCLINNASSSEPGGVIERCPAVEIDSHVRIGLVAPMILTSLFIGRFAGAKIRKKVVFISSGAAFEAFPGDAVYCSTKAGLNMLAQCVGIEQKDKEFGFESISIGPGMVDTSMQQVARSKNNEEYPSAELMRQAYEQGLLEKPESVAEKICKIIENKYEQGKFVRVSDV